MNLKFCVNHIRNEYNKGMTLDQAVGTLEEGGFPDIMVEKARAAFEEQIAKLKVEAIPRTLRASDSNWYLGPDLERDPCWPALRSYLLEKKGWDKEVVNSVDRSSTGVLRCIHAPGTEPGFGTRGLVLGYVQSGKTANFTALTAKAADRSFKFFIVLAGLHNSLRRQTQERLEKELVQLNPNLWHKLTTADEDFVPHGNASAFLSEHSNQRVLCVIKKNPSRLQKFLDWVRSVNDNVLKTCPVLVIDDEADQASINTGGSSDDEDRSRINSLIVDILNAFPKCAYVGYTATPFANVLSDPTWDRGLYPRDFIVSLDQPDAYFGAERLFGQPPETADDEVEPLDMLRDVDEDEATALQPDSRDTRHEFQPELTPSLQSALRWFLLSSAARLARGQSDQHMSMLIHTTVYTDVHLRFREPINNEIHLLHARVTENDRATLDELQSLWDDETSRVPAASVGETPTSWAEVRAQLGEALERVKVVVDNTLSEERLSFPKEGGSVQVIIGGNTLSRGLTIEGLCVSFFLRASSTYDTLLQMGRWFGYRKGYADLPRIWMPLMLQDDFRHLSHVEQEIREDIQRMAREDSTPLDVAVRVRTHSTLAVTSRMKMQHAEKRQVSYNAVSPKQTTSFHHRDEDWLRGNIEAARTLLQASNRVLAPENVWGRNYLYRNIPVEHVLGFFDQYQIHERHLDMKSELIRKYITDQAADGRLLGWNIGVVGRGRPDGDNGVWQGFLPDGLPINLINRSRLDRTPGDADVGVVMSQVDRTLDFGLDKPPPVSDYRDWAKQRGLFDERSRTFVEWAADYRSPLDPDDRDQVVPERGIGMPALLLYPINKDSDSKSRNRSALNAKAHVVALALIFPRTQRDTPQTYMTVDLSNVKREVPDRPDYDAMDTDE